MTRMDHMVDWFAGEYHAACGPCGTISSRSARFNYRSRKRANRALQFKVGDSARTRERRSEWGRDRREGNKERRSEAYLGQSTKKCTRERNVESRTAGRVGACNHWLICWGVSGGLRSMRYHIATGNLYFLFQTLCTLYIYTNLYTLSLRSSSLIPV